MNPSLNDLVRAALGESVAQEAGMVEKTAAVKAQSLPVPSATSGYAEFEKLATALEFVGRRGVENLIKTEAAAPAAVSPPLDKTASVKHDPEQVRAALAKKLAAAAAGGQ